MEPLAPPDLQGKDFAGALRAAVTARGLSLSRLRARLAEHGISVSTATLSYWQSGRSRPERAASRAAIGPLEDVLELPRGFLAVRLPTRAGVAAGVITGSVCCSECCPITGRSSRRPTPSWG